ncbi:MAG TPA: hypothetical protein VMB50_00075 [Myxococcales bacterium]|nr:hypothetical protein [Myxococcales bacterium]
MRYELKARTAPEILDGSFKLYRDHLWPLLAISAIGAVPTMLFSRLQQQHAGPGDQGGLLLSLAGIVSLLFFTVQYGALISASVDAYLGRPYTVGGAYLKVLPLLGGFLWVGLIWSFAVGFGLILLVIPGLYWMVLWSMWPQALIVENKRGWEALNRSRALAKGAFWKLALLLFLVAVVQYALIFGARAALPHAIMAIPVLGALLTAIPSVVLFPLPPILLTLFYFDGRIRHEGWDLEMKAAEAAPSGAAA